MWTPSTTRKPTTATMPSSATSEADGFSTYESNFLDWSRDAVFLKSTIWIVAVIESLFRVLLVGLLSSLSSKERRRWRQKPQRKSASWQRGKKKVWPNRWNRLPTGKCPMKRLRTSSSIKNRPATKKARNWSICNTNPNLHRTIIYSLLDTILYLWLFNIKKHSQIFAHFKKNC